MRMPVAVAAAIVTLLTGCASTPERQGSSSPSPTGTPLNTPSSPPLAQAPTASAATTVTYPVRCRTDALRLTLGDLVSEATGQHTTMLILTNAGSRGCHLLGYPAVELRDSKGATLPFQYRPGGEDMMLTNQRPHTVGLAPRARAYFAINKYRCDLAGERLATSVLVTPPGDATSLRLALPHDRGVDYCGKGDPGSIVDISPIEPTERAVGRF